MQYDFPILRHISDVLPHVIDQPEFIVAERPGFIVINYQISIPGMFGDGSNDLSLTNSIRRECRGLIFNSETGNILSRPYHKFFNMNEYPETQVSALVEKCLKYDHVYLSKLDGSMIRPLVLNNQVKWATKMGFTDVADQCASFIKTSHYDYNGFALLCHKLNFTPIFEWISPDNRIVISYPKSELVLTAIRDNIDGTYYNAKDIMSKMSYNIPTVSEDVNYHGSLSDLQKISEIEGVVIRFSDGHMVKVKTEWYVTLHKSKEIAAQLHKVVQCILSDTVDDLKSNLAEADRLKVEELEYKINTYILTKAAELSDSIKSIKSIIGDNKKSFAVDYVAKGVFDDFSGVAFKIWDNQLPIDAVRTFIQQKITTKKKCELFLSQMG